MEEIINFLNMVAQEISDAQASTTGVALAIGILNCFLGYCLLRVWVSLTGFAVGALAGYTFSSRLTGSSLVQIAALAAGGLILGMLAFYIYYAGVFLLCTNVGIVAASILLVPGDSLKFTVCLGIGIVVGLVGMTFVKPMVILYTALGGGFSIAASAAGILQKEADLRILILGAGLSLAGIIVQIITAVKMGRGDTL